MSLPHICLPVDLDVFILNEKVCDVKKNIDSQSGSELGVALIAPITQPNYVNLRLSNDQIQHDILPKIDLHNSRDGQINPRLSSTLQKPFRNVTATDPIGKSDSLSVLSSSRQGVYLHWTIPRAYRSAVSEAAPPSALAGDTVPVKTDTNPSPRFPLVPNRWLVVRLLQPGWTPQTAKPDPVTAWVIESDRLRNVDDLRTDDNGLPIDLETDISPFVAWTENATSDPDILNSQAEKYIGFRTPLAKWKEQQPSADQKVNLTIMNSSNPLFADYAPHNANVFSTKDNFFYGRDANGQPLFLTSATCDYIVLGWHSDLSADPLGTDNAVDLASRLSRLFCASPPPIDENDTTTKGLYSKTDQTRLICHAARYDVTWSQDLPSSVAANDYAVNFTRGVDMEPVSVGTSALDAILAFFQAHSNDTLDTDVLGKDAASTAQAIMGIRELLYATEDDYDSRIKAADLVFAHNYGRSPAGFVWRFDKKKEKNGPPIEPSSVRPDPSTHTDSLSQFSEVELVHKINEYQKRLDVASAKLDQLRWAMFAEWFKCLSDPTPGREGLYSSRVPLLRTEAGNLQLLIDALQSNSIEPITKKVDVKKVAQDPFFQRKDPTLCLAGIDAGWDPDFLDNTPTRFANRLSSSGPETNRPDVTACANMLQDQTKFSAMTSSGVELDTTPLSQTLTTLLQEASRGFQPSLSRNGHRKWTGQPFKPQFIEWEGIYHHVDWTPENWDLRLANSALASSNHKQVTYVNQVDLSKLDGPRKDRRSISGRMLILPQPSFALGAVVAQVLDGTPKNLLPDSLKDVAARQALKENVKALKFVSGEMDGLTDALLTMAKGQHVKPNVRKQGDLARPMQAAVTAVKKIDMKDEDLTLISGQSGRTPYGTLVNFDAPDASPVPFKGVQHGQFAITSLVIVDKFGQTVACPFPKRKKRPVDSASSSRPIDELDFIHPCLSEQLIPSLLDGSLNTVYTTQDTHDAATASGVPMTPFIQLQPAINQNARVNATFLRRAMGKENSSWWQPCTDWENPIIGWIIVNYADSALQFFTADGTYYTSRQFGGPTGTIESLKWLPFDPPPQSQTGVTAQLDQLIAKMGEQLNNAGANYLKALWDIVRSAIPTMPFPPSDYAAFANAIVGKPLALVNAGWSIELAEAPYWKQYTLPAPPNPASDATVDPLRTEAETNMKKYNFKVKIGDAERPFDGVVAYWDTDNVNTTTIDDPNSSTKTHYDKFWAYTESDVTKGISNLIEPSKFPTLTPYFLHPDLAPDAETFTRQQTSQLMVKTLLIDPYTPIHLYSGILPIKSLQLPAWTIQNALKNMTAFFIMGPVLVPRDVPKQYDTAHPLKPDSWYNNPVSTTVDEDPIKLPIAGGKGMWNWLQPYLTTETDEKGVVTQETRYNALSVGAEDGRLRLDPAPYTFVEGYLQLARPLIQPPLPAGSS